MFKDHFSKQADLYRRYRPGYPPALFEWLAQQVQHHRVALDCATGNGQAAVGVADWFERVVAIDGSPQQLALAVPDPRVTYCVNVAEKLALRDASVDLVMAAQAAHWFDSARFHAEVERVLVPGGVVALWTYEKFRVNRDVDAVIDRFYNDVIGPYWPPERRHVELGYRALPFPYPEIDSPAFELTNRWDLPTMIGHIGSWSAVQRYRDVRQHDPLPDLATELAPFVNPGRGTVELRWPIHMRVGRP